MQTTACNVPYPYYPASPTMPYYRETTAPAHTPLPNIYEQMGTDPTSKLAAAIDRLAAVLEKMADQAIGG